MKSTPPLVLVCLIGCLPLLCACGKSDKREQGAALYSTYCSSCHNQRQPELITQPPKLDGLFQRKTLSDGKPANDATVRSIILHGKGIMPRFEGTLNQAQVNAIVDYLHAQ